MFFIMYIYRKRGRVMSVFRRTPKDPWKKYYKKEDRDLDAPDISMYQLLKEEQKRYQIITQ